MKIGKRKPVRLEVGTQVIVAGDIMVVTNWEWSRSGYGHVDVVTKEIWDRHRQYADHS